jgi:hypothetical protein
MSTTARLVVKQTNGRYASKLHTAVMLSATSAQGAPLAEVPLGHNRMATWIQARQLQFDMVPHDVSAEEGGVWQEAVMCV